MIALADVMAVHNAAVPRYTSYPTAPQFQPDIGAALCVEMIDSLSADNAVSVYIHIPFCDRLCWFCGCNTKHTLKYEPITRYVEHVIDEIAILRTKTDVRAPITQLHFGGGSPSLLHPSDMTRLREALDTLFVFSDDTEISVEIDPSDSNPEMYEGLKALGMTRASIGVQDFDEAVQKAINRPQTFEQTAEVVHRLREMGIKSINMDALYGLPLQTEERLLKTLEQCVSLNPDRIALFGYAHVPWMKKHQQMIRDEDLASPAERYDNAQKASQFLRDAGYIAIGIDHFAKPTDSMAIAAANGTLHRNFQGYTTDNTDTLIGIGGSSIGKFAGGYIQNTVATGIYEAQIEHGKLPANKGYRMSEDDRMRSYFIERLMCDLRVDMSVISRDFPALYPAFAKEVIAVVQNDNLGLCALEDGVFFVPDEARSFTRIVASLFDALFAPAEKKFSQAV